MSAGARLGARDWLLAVSSGLLAGLSQPLVIAPLGKTPVDPTGLTGLFALVALVPLLVSARRRSAGQAFLLGTAAFTVHHLVLAHWLVIAFHVYGGVAAPVAVLATAALSALLAALVASSLAVAWRISSSLRVPLWLSFPPALAGIELLRNYVPAGGCPWGNLGSSLASVDVLRQGASLVGVYGLVFFVALVNAAIAEAVSARLTGKPFPKVPVALASLLLVGLLGYGSVRLGAPAAEGPTVRVALLQASLDQDVVNRASENEERIRAAYHRLQARALTEGAEVVVWPEAALVPRVPMSATDLLREGMVPRDVVESVATEPDAALRRIPPAAVVGAITYDRVFSEQTSRLVDVVRTSAIVTGAGGQVRGRFDKTHLVPFGEYVPWPLSLLMDKLVSVQGTLTPGEEILALALPTTSGERPVGAMICYEGVFPEIARAYANAGATQLYNLTNDAWYGTSSAAWQHLYMYAMRATETARPIARAANTGVSAWVDARGRIHDASPMFEESVVVADVPFSDETTLYLLLGDWLALGSLILVALGLALSFVAPRFRPGRLTRQ